MQEVAHRTVPSRLRPWLGLLVLSAAGAGIVVAGDGAARALRYERNAILDGQVWRLVTSHLVVGSWARLGADIVLAALLVAAYGRHLRSAALLVSAVGTSAGLFLFFAVLVHSHAGPSGPVAGIAVFGALEGWRRGWRRSWLPILPLLLLVALVDASMAEPFAGLGDPGSVQRACLCGGISGGLAFAMLYRPGGRRG